MSDMAEVFNALKRRNKRRKAGNRRDAEREFEDARQFASEHGLILRRCHEAQYQLEKRRSWMMNIYPGNQRIYNSPRCKNRPDKPPFLDMGGIHDDDFCLMVVVQAAVEGDEL